MSSYIIWRYLCVSTYGVFIFVNKTKVDGLHI